MLDPTREDPRLRAELVLAFERVLAGGQLILGPEVLAFERACADRLGVAHAIGVSSGSDALLVSLMALGVGPGDEVVCPAYTFFSPAGAAARLGAKPVFVDVTPCCLTAPAAAIEQAITPRTKAIVPVHLYGQCADMVAIAAVARARGVALVEDAAQAFGAGAGGRAAGAWGELGCFSFFPTKNLGGLGDGGLVTTSDAALADRVRLLRTHGARPKYHHVAVGGNFRLDALQAALLATKLPWLDGHLAARREIARAYDTLFVESGIAEPGGRCGGEHGSRKSRSPVVLPSTCREPRTFHQYVIRAEGVRDELRAFLRERGVEAHVYYPEPLHLQPCFAESGHDVPRLPEAERAAGDSLALPIFPGMTGEEVSYVVEAAAAFFRERPRAR